MVSIIKTTIIAMALLLPFGQWNGRFRCDILFNVKTINLVTEILGLKSIEIATRWAVAIKAIGMIWQLLFWKG